jgi:hypothetical protein
MVAMPVAAAKLNMLIATNAPMFLLGATSEADQ